MFFVLDLQSICFDIHIDRPRYLKFFLGYDNDYLSIYLFIGHSCFIVTNMLKCKEKRELKAFYMTKCLDD